MWLYLSVAQASLPVGILIPRPDILFYGCYIFKIGLELRTRIETAGDGDANSGSRKGETPEGSPWLPEYIP
jgi:hypothetical protein